MDRYLPYFKVDPSKHIPIPFPYQFGERVSEFGEDESQSGEHKTEF